MKTFTYKKNLLLLIIIITFISACSSSPKQFNKTKNLYCKNANLYENKVIGSGHCVALIQKCSAAPHTRFWRPSIKVKGNKIPAGSIIATFKKGHYPNKSGYHAAVYISQDKKGLWVWDQWLGKPVHKRLIRFKNGKGKASNDGDRYSLVKFIY